MLAKEKPKPYSKFMQMKYAEGFAQGIKKGKSEALARRFGPLDDETKARIESASVEKLDVWGDRILDAPSLEAVFYKNDGVVSSDL